MVEGTVKFFNRTNHYGFIDGEDGKSYFVHSSGLAEGTAIDEEDKVSFDATEGERGPKAENVKKLDSSNEEKAEEAPAKEVEEEPAEASEEATEEVAEEKAA